MKRVLPIFLLSMVLFCFNLMAQNWVNGGNALTANGTLGTTTNFSVLFKTNNIERGRITNTGLWGIGTSAPENKLHVFKGSAGTVTGWADAPLIVENSVNSYINILAPNAKATGILFGKPSNNISGGIVYNDISFNPNGLDFRTNGNLTKMVLNSAGNLGIGTTSPISKLHISVSGTNAYQGLGITSTNAGGKTLTINQGTPGKLNFTEPGVVDLMTMDFTSKHVAVAGNVGVGTTDGIEPIDPGDYKLKISADNFGLDIENPISNANWELRTQPYTEELELFLDGSLEGAFSNDGTYTKLSDERLKTNIKPMSTMLEKIKELKPSTYQFKNTKDKQEHNGFIAQDVMKIFPDLVVHNVIPERKINVYTMDYSGFGVLAIKGIQELAPIVEEQKEKIATLEDRISKMEAVIASITANKNGNISNAITNSSLEQNKPNPFNKSTIINYTVPQGSKGQINIYDQTGKLVKSVNANESGQSELSGYDLKPGTYTYTLMVNGKVSISKQMLIIK